jgi:hypothetical protein
VHGQFDGAADHERCEFGVRRRRGCLAHDLSEADDGDAVGDFADLSQFVGDEDDRRAGFPELPHDDHEFVGLLRGEDRGRLVEDEDFGVPGQRLDDLDPLLHSDGEVFDERIGVDVKSEAGGDLAHLRAGRLQVELAGEGGLFVAEHDVLGDGEDGDQHEVLVNHPDSGGHGVAGAGEALDDIVEEDLPVVGLVQAVQDIHQRRFTRTVLTEQGMDLSSLHGEVYVIVGDQGTESLRDAAKF